MDISRVSGWLLNGNSDAIRTNRESLLAAAKRQRRAANRVFLRTTAVSQFLAMIDKKGALRALQPFVVERDPGGTVMLAREHLERLDARSRARILIQAANLAYRHLDFDNGSSWAEEAEELLHESTPPLSSLEFVLDWSEIAIWRVRLGWRRTRAADVHDELKMIVHRLEAAYVPANERGFRAVTLHLAIALELWAAIDWFQGRITDARTKIFRSIALHGEVHDLVRSAYAHFTAARIEYSHERSEFTWADHLVHVAESQFRKLKHPFLWRAMNLRARCLLRQRRVAEARTVAKAVPFAVVKDAAERTYAEGEQRLTLAWIHEASAKKAAHWRDALQQATFLVDHRTGLPTRLRAEGYLHRAIARLHLDDSIDGALADLNEAWTLGKEAGSTKLLIACELATADCLIKAKKDVAADYHLQRAERSLRKTESHFLRTWHIRVAGRLNSRVPISMDCDWKTSRAAYRRSYYMYHVLRSSSVPDVLERTGWAEATYDVWRSEFGSYIGRPNALPNGARPYGIDPHSKPGRSWTT